MSGKQVISERWVVNESGEHQHSFDPHELVTMFRLGLYDFTQIPVAVKEEKMTKVPGERPRAAIPKKKKKLGKSDFKYKPTAYSRVKR